MNLYLHLLSKVIDPGNVVLEPGLSYELEPCRDLHAEDGLLLAVDVPVHEVAQASVVDRLVLVQVPGYQELVVR